MKVLIACEESQEVCNAFREKGHEAYSCDIQEPSGGHPYHKKTCLWLKGLPPLEPTEIVMPTMYWVQGQGPRGKGHPGGHRSQKERSKTFPGIAKAMAEQWGRIGIGWEDVPEQAVQMHIDDLIGGKL